MAEEKEGEQKVEDWRNKEAKARVNGPGCIFLIACIITVWLNVASYKYGLIEFPTIPTDQEIENRKIVVNKKNFHDNKRNVHVVVSHCDTSIDWIWKYFAEDPYVTELNLDSKVEYSLKSVSVMSKCDIPILLQDIPAAESPIVNVLSLPNIGRCDHTYAYWIEQVMLATKGESEDEGHRNGPRVIFSTYKHDGNPFGAIASIMDPTDLVLFMKDHDNEVYKDKMIGNIVDVLDTLTVQEQRSSFIATNFSSFKGSGFTKSITRGLSCQYRPLPIQRSKYAKWVNKCISVFKRHLLWTLQFDKYVRLSRDKNDAFKSPHRPMGRWVNHFSEQARNQIVFSKDYYEQVIKGIIEKNNTYAVRDDELQFAPACFGGIFATYWGQLSSDDAPLTLEGWKAVTKSLSRGNSIEEGHYMERWWGDLLSWSSWATIFHYTVTNNAAAAAPADQKFDSSRGITLPKKEQLLLLAN
mmetsp:Transcript_2084/g.4918  ORF Transcript_2084/g.4918 Transcript_2084/m.4918 type:complete len:468 (-) Transcript_2084:178-1581(-)